MESMRSTLRLTCAALTAISLVSSSEATAQQSFTERMNARHAKQAPLVGDTVPDASGFTLDGEPFALKADRGNLTVIVFGCLT